MTSLQDIGAAIKNAESILICGHIMPDGDCLGSVLALGLSLEAMGKKVIMASPDPVPALYDFLPGVSRFHIGEPPVDDFETIIILDCSVPQRLGKGYQELLALDYVIINIDHHFGPGLGKGYNYIDTSAAAVGEIVFDLLRLMQVDISVEAGINLFTAIVTDTGSFRYDNVNSATHQRAAELLALGVPGAKIYLALYDENPLVSLFILREALHTLTLSPDGKIAWMTVTLEMFEKTGARGEHTENLVNYCKSIRGVEIAILFREISEGAYKISLRSKHQVDVNKLANKFGGGGHVRAAGCTMTGNLTEVQESLVKEALIAMAGKD
ncbi:MAG: bifunctional oligoribonuclease/PAP phosphatase NrnA [Peptococcaceae bacterium]|jgi:phosphoesterase RecJ-like protein|nr:bifunctional oligoribonuclease/PAP phosphatase NrnA [Peptococcaceae bacterium]